MKKLPQNTPNYGYYIAAEKCDRALDSFLNAYEELRRYPAPTVVEYSDIDDIIVYMKSYLKAAHGE